MSMVDCKAVFSEALAGKAQLVSGHMTYLQEGRQQCLTFVVQLPNGTNVTITEIIPAGTNPVLHASQMAAAWAALN